MMKNIHFVLVTIILVAGVVVGIVGGIGYNNLPLGILGIASLIGAYVIGYRL